MSIASRDENRIATLLGVSSSGYSTPITVAVNPSTHAMLVEATVTPTGTQDVNLIQVGGAAIAIGQAAMAASLPIVIASNQTWTGATNLGKNEDAAHASGDTGVLALAVRNDSLASFTTTDGDYSPIAVNNAGLVAVKPQGDYAAGADGESNSNPGWQDFAGNALYPHSHGYVYNGSSWDRVRSGSVLGTQLVSVVPTSSNGASTMNASSSDGATALTNSAQVIKSSAGTLKGYYIYNPNSSAQFVQFYNTAAASVTVGTTNPLFMLTIPATGAANLWMTDGINFSNAGWSWAATSTAGGNGAPSTALDAICWYA